MIRAAILALLVLGPGLLSGCASPRPAAPRSGPAGSTGGEVQPWQIPAEAFGRQLLYRVHYSGPEGEGSLRLTLRLAGPERYQINVADALGRAVWNLDVEGNRGLWLDHRGSTFCGFKSRTDFLGLPLTPFPLLSLPALLLGRLPSEPEGQPEQDGDSITFHDSRDRRWTAEVRGGRPESWTLWEGSTPAVWWSQRDSWMSLSDRQRKVQIRWREVLQEELRDPLQVLRAPEGYRERCDPAALAPAPS